MRGRAWVGAVGITAVVISGACGDGEEALTKAGFLERGNAICATTENEIRSAADSTFPRDKVPDAQQLARFTDETIEPAFMRQLEELGDLKPPKEDKESVDSILEEGRKGLDKLKSQPTTIISRDTNPLVRYDQLANDYGLSTCGEFSAKLRDRLSGVPSRTGA